MTTLEAIDALIVEFALSFGRMPTRLTVDDETFGRMLRECPDAFMYAPPGAKRYCGAELAVCFPDSHLIQLDAQ